MKMYVCGSMNGLGAAWMYLGIASPSMALLGLGIATFVGQYVVQLWPIRSPQENASD